MIGQFFVIFASLKLLQTDIDFCGLAIVFSHALCCNNLHFYIIHKYTVYFC